MAVGPGKPPTLFAGGYLLNEGSEDLRLPDAVLEELIAGWSSVRLGRYLIRYDGTWRCTHATVGEAEIVMLGTAMDLESPSSSQDAAVEAITAALDVSDAAFLDRFDSLVGAYVVFTRRGDRYWVLQDTTAMEGLAYDNSGQGTLVASHPALIADIRGYEISELGQLWLPNGANPEAKKWKLWAGPWHLPGVTSPYERVRALTPNTRLDLASGQVERFFPREPIGVLDMDTIVETVAGHLRDALAWVVAEFPDAASVSLSGGLDSRLTLAASKPYVADLRYFTYHFPRHPVHESDLRIARTLAERFDLAHSGWPLKPGRDMRATAADWARTHRGIHGNGTVEYSYREHFPTGDLHVRSNVLEVVRGYFIKNPVNRKDKFDVAKLGRLFRQGTGRTFVPPYEEYVAVTGFTMEAKQDMHYTDLYHWEQRLGRWHSEVVRRSKISHNTFIIWNSRRVLKLMLARPPEDRWKARVILRLIDHLWRDVLQTPIFSGARIAALPADLPVGPSAFDWTRLSPEARRAFACALAKEELDEEAATRLLVTRVPFPDAAFFADRRVVDAALDWLRTDPVARAQVQAAIPRVRRWRRPRGPSPSEPADLNEHAEWFRELKLRFRVDTSGLRAPLLAALLETGGRPPAIADTQTLRPYVSVPTGALNARALHPYQHKVPADIRQLGHDPARPPQGLIAMPPGAGARKTVTRWLVEDVVNAGGHVLWVTHRSELLQQAALAFAEGASVLRGRSDFLRLRLSGGGFGSGPASLAARDHDVAIVTIGSLTSDPLATRRLLEQEELVVVLDEAQHSTAPTWQRLLESAGDFGRHVIGVARSMPASAEEEHELRALYGDTVLARVDPHELISAGWLAVPHLRRVESQVVADAGLSPADLSGGDLPPQVASRLAQDDSRNALIVQTWKDGPPEGGRYGQTIVYAIDAAHAEALSQRFRDTGTRANWITPERPERHTAIHRFRSGVLDVIVTSAILPEGAELPNASSVFLCAPLHSDGMLAEMLDSVMAGPEAKGTEIAHVVSIEDRWEELTDWLDPADVLPSPQEREGEPDDPAPAAWYRFEAEVPLAYGELEARRQTIPVAPHQLGGYDAMAAAAEDDPAALQVDGHTLQARFFGGTEAPLPAARSLSQLADYALKHGAMPVRRAMAIRD